MSTPHESTAGDAASDDTARAQADALDGWLHAQVASTWGGLSPIALGLAAADWALHLATQPAQTCALPICAVQMATNAAWDAFTNRPVPTGASERPDDHRFQSEAWRTWPYPWIVRSYLDAERWWRDATRLRGMTRHHQEIVQLFVTLWTAAHQAPLSLGFSRQEHWSGVSSPSPTEELNEPIFEIT